LPNCWRPIFLVLPKLDRCQIDLPNCWSCSKGLTQCDWNIQTFFLKNLNMLSFFIRASPAVLWTSLSFI
jgi:hypothetical protein